MTDNDIIILFDFVFNNHFGNFILNEFLNRSFVRLCVFQVTTLNCDQPVQPSPGKPKVLSNLNLNALFLHLARITTFALRFRIKFCRCSFEFHTKWCKRDSSALYTPCRSCRLCQAGCLTSEV